MTQPTIQSIGPPPERHAQRLAAEMTRWLISEQHTREAEWRHAIRHRNDGNPKAQQKLVDRLAKIGGPNLFSLTLTPGKRRKYELVIHRWVGWSHADVLVEGDEIPERPWIACLLQRVISTYAKTDVEEYVTALIGHHAIARLAERCGARTPADILTHARKLSNATLRAMGGENPIIPIPANMPPGGWRIPFSHGVAVLILDDETGLPVIATVLPQQGA